MEFNGEVLKGNKERKRGETAIKLNQKNQYLLNTVESPELG